MVKTELLLNLKNFAQQWFLLTTIDEERFKKYMENFYYKDGVVGSDKTKNGLLSTVYKDGRVYVDSVKDIFLNDGVFKADDDENVTLTNGSLTIP
jgi:hypothetical protein